jgi:chaperonin cofactor prefoldin
VYQIREMQEWIEGSIKELEILETDLQRRHIVGSTLIREMDKHVQILQDMTFEAIERFAKITDALDRKIDRMDQRYPVRLEEKVIRKDLKGIDIGSTGI